MMRTWLGVSATVMLATSVAGCAYYNAMWSAERYAKEARRLESRGQVSEARSQWAQAAVKAEAVMTKHPKSKWADDAQVLQIEGLARSGACEDGADLVIRARASVKEPALRERAELVAAECALGSRRTSEADAALALPLGSKDSDRRSRAEYLAGAAALQRADYDAAILHFERSRERAALPARARAELLAGRANEASAALDALRNGPGFENDRAELFAQLAIVGGPDAASAALDRMLERTRIPEAERAKLLTADADRRLAHGDVDAAADRYRRAIVLAPAASPEAGAALVGQQLVSIVRAERRSDLKPIGAELARILRVEPGGGPAKRWLDLVNALVVVPETPGLRFRSAEIARDSLNADRLAGHLFLDAAASDTASLFTPKALLAALVLLPERRDSITQVLDTRYAASPYTRAFRGEPSVAYAAAEDSLARELGVQLAHSGATPFIGVRFDAPVPGPRGPGLDEPGGARATPATARPRVPAREQARPTPGRAVPPAAPPPARDRPVVPERP